MDTSIERLFFVIRDLNKKYRMANYFSPSGLDKDIYDQAVSELMAIELACASININPTHYAAYTIHYLPENGKKYLYVESSDGVKSDKQCYK